MRPHDQVQPVECGREICATSKLTPWNFLLPHASLPHLFHCLWVCLYTQDGPGSHCAEGRTFISWVLEWLTAWSKSPSQPWLLIQFYKSEEWIPIVLSTEIWRYLFWSAPLTLVLTLPLLILWGFPSGAGGKEPACQCRRLKRRRFNPWVRKIPWRGHGNSLQRSSLENPIDRGACGLQSIGLQRVGHDCSDLAQHKKML